MHKKRTISLNKLYILNNLSNPVIFNFRPHKSALSLCQALTGYSMQSLYTQGLVQKSLRVHCPPLPQTILKFMKTVTGGPAKSWISQSHQMTKMCYDINCFFHKQHCNWLLLSLKTASSTNIEIFFNCFLAIKNRMSVP